MTKQEERKLRQYIKTSNQRIVEIEKRTRKSQSIKYTDYSAYQYQLKASKDAKTSKFYGMSASGHLKFKTDISKLTEKEREEMFKLVEAFTKAKTSTISGIKEVRKQQEKKFKEKMQEKGIDTNGLSFDDMARAWKEYKEKNASKNLSSDAVNEIISKYYDPEHPDFFADMVNDPTFQDMPLVDIMDMPTFNEWEQANRSRTKAKKGLPVKSNSGIYRKKK